MGLIVWRAIVPLALASIITGLVMSLGTRWGLFKHWWVLISFLLTLGATFVLIVEAANISRWAAIATDPAMSTEELRGLGNTLPHSVGGMVVLVVIMVLNFYKPPGLTSYGSSRQAGARTGPQP